MRAIVYKPGRTALPSAQVPIAAMSTRPYRFLHRGRVVAVDAPPTRTLLEWLREDARATGTKEGCAEGDCGACTVILARLDDAAPGGVALRTVNACIQFLPMVDGQAVLTVEDLGDGGLHPAQQAMVDCHGSQCGFCTPGFVMSLVQVHERHADAGTRPSRAELCDDLAGNLCRCTGYRPILDAGERMFDAPAARIDREALAHGLRALRDDPPLAHEHGGRRVWAPRTLDEFAAIRERHPEARLLAGCTDIGLWVNKQMRDVGDLLYVGEVAELRRIEVGDGALRIGAAVPLEAAWQALVRHWPALDEMHRRFASPPVRHAGTLVGNLANGSPIGDGAPVLMALGATLVLRRGASARECPLDRFYTGYQRNVLQPGEFIEAVSVPLPAAGQRVQAYKLSKRFDSDISAVAAGLSIVLDGETVREARFAFGGLAEVVRRAAGAEAAVTDRPWNEAAVQAAMQVLDDDFRPITDLRASAAYRRSVARRLLQRFWLQTRPQAPLAEGELNVALAR